MKKTLSLGDANILLLYYGIAVWCMEIVASIMLLMGVNYILVNEIMVLFTILPALFYIKASGASVKEVINARKFKFSHLILVILLVVLVYIGVTLATAIAATIVTMIGGTIPDYSYLEDLMSGPMWLTLLVTCVGAPFMEEFFVRGALLNGYRKRGRTYAIVMSGVVFGLMHADPIRFVPTAILGVVLAMVAIYMNSWWPAVIYHALHNLLATTGVMEEYFLNLPWLINSSLPAVETPAGSMLFTVYLFGVGTVAAILAGIILAKLAKKAPVEPMWNEYKSAPKITGAGIAGMILISLRVLVVGATYFA